MTAFITPSVRALGQWFAGVMADAITLGIVSGDKEGTIVDSVIAERGVPRGYEEMLMEVGLKMFDTLQVNFKSQIDRVTGGGEKGPCDAAIGLEGIGDLDINVQNGADVERWRYLMPVVASSEKIFYSISDEAGKHLTFASSTLTAVSLEALMRRNRLIADIADELADDFSVGYQDLDEFAMNIAQSRKTIVLSNVDDEKSKCAFGYCELQSGSEIVVASISGEESGLVADLVSYMAAIGAKRKTLARDEISGYTFSSIAIDDCVPDEPSKNITTGYEDNELFGSW